MNVHALLEKDVGPLPVGGWMVVVGAGLGVAWWRKRQAALTATNTPADDTQGPLLTDQTLGNIGGLLAALNNGKTGVETSGIQDNTTWYRKAVQVLLAKGNDPTLVDSALRKYVNGIALSRSEQAVVDQALQDSSVGPLPTPPPPPDTSNAGHTNNANPSIGNLLTHASPTNIAHLSNIDLMSAVSLTTTPLTDPTDAARQRASLVGIRYGTTNPLDYVNELARRYQTGQINDAELTGPVGPWTFGQPAYHFTWNDINNTVQQLQAMHPNDVQFQTGGGTAA